MPDAFAPPPQGWSPVSPRLRVLRRTLVVSVGAIAALVSAVLAGALVGAWLAVLTLLAVAALTGWGCWLVERNYRSWGYAERDDDLLVTHGVLFKKLVVVPYGRMQFVDVTAGPLDRRFGVRTLQLHTAAAATDATIPGLPPEEAGRLRDRLAALGEARSAGL